MKKGIVISSALSHKNGNTILRAGAKVTEADLHNFDLAVKGGHVKEDVVKVEKPKAKKDK